MVPERLSLFHMDSPCTLESLVGAITSPLDLSRLPVAERASAETKVLQQEFFDLATDFLCQLLGLVNQASWPTSPPEAGSYTTRWFCGLLESTPHFKSYFAHEIVEDLTRVRI
jgi:hypothetical protein